MSYELDDYLASVDDEAKRMTHYVKSYFASRTLCGRNEDEVHYVERLKLDAQLLPHICTECYEEATRLLTND